MQETWKIIENSKDYAISNFGKIKRLEHLKISGNKKWLVKDKILKPSKCNTKKYWRIKVFYKNGSSKIESIHRLVAFAFVSNPNKYEQVNHIDMDKNNNKAGNLEWCTNLYNTQQSFIVGDRKKSMARGEDSHFNKYSEEFIKQIEVLSQSGMKACNIAKQLNIPKTLISEIKRGKAWNHLDLKIKNNRFVPVIQKTLTGDFIKKWESIAEAANFVKGSQGTLAMCLKGTRRTHKGFIWEKVC